MDSSTIKTLTVSLILFITCAVVGGVILETSGHDGSTIFTFALAIVPVIGTVVYQGAQNNKKVEEVKSTVNGTLDAKLTAQTVELKQHTDNQIVALMATPKEPTNGSAETGYIGY